MNWPTRLDVYPLVDPVVDGYRIDVRSAYAETFWLPVIGPTSLLLLRRFADHLDAAERPPVRYDAEDLALAIGIGGAGKLRHTLDRLVRFAMVRPLGQAVEARRYVAPVPARLLSRLPASLRQAHDGLMDIGAVSEVSE